MSSATGLFKYFGTDADKLGMFVAGQVYLTPPIYLNDYSEFLMLSTGPSRNFLEREVPFLPAGSLADFQAFVSTPDSLLAEARELQDKLSHIIGLVCLTEHPVNELMWAHYGQSHAGFVAEFWRGPEESSETGFPLCKTPFGPAMKVRYLPKKPFLERDTSNEEQVVAIKYDCWKYEDEWRVIWPLARAIPHPKKSGHRLREFKPNELLRVVLGLKVTDEVRSRLSAMLNHKDFKHVLRESIVIDPHSSKLKNVSASW